MPVNHILSSSVMLITSELFFSPKPERALSFIMLSSVYHKPMNSLSSNNLCFKPFFSQKNWRHRTIWYSIDPGYSVKSCFLTSPMKAEIAKAKFPFETCFKLSIDAQMIRESQSGWWTLCDHHLLYKSTAQLILFSIFWAKLLQLKFSISANDIGSLNLFLSSTSPPPTFFFDTRPAFISKNVNRAFTKTGLKRQFWHSFAPSSSTVNKAKTKYDPKNPSKISFLPSLQCRSDKLVVRLLWNRLIVIGLETLRWRADRTEIQHIPHQKNISKPHFSSIEWHQIFTFASQDITLNIQKKKFRRTHCRRVEINIHNRLVTNTFVHHIDLFFRITVTNSYQLRKLRQIRKQKV